MSRRRRVREILNPITQKLEMSYYPVTKEEAIAEGLPKYQPFTPCPIHGGYPVYYVLSGVASCCVHTAAVAEYNLQVLTNKEPRTIREAKERGLDYSWDPQAHDECGHPGKRLFNGRCAICREEKDNSPRQLAIKAGDAWYTPRDTDPPCPNGHHAPRRVVNGSCKQCEEDKRIAGKAQQDQPIHKVCPDLVIERGDAKALGYKVFRTGKPCKKGHMGWRYVSTGGCLICKEG